MEEIRLALLDADVNYNVVMKFVEEVRQECLGQEVLKGVSPGQQAVKIVSDHLTTLMGSDVTDLQLDGEPTVIMLCGLQGSGKTTTAAKLAQFLQKKYKKSVLFAACDIQRPAAIDQLEVLGHELSLPVYTDRECKVVPQIAMAAVQEAKRQKRDVVILDTAGRLQVDEVLVQELIDIKNMTHPQEILLVADSALGQEAVSVAEHFNDALDITGIILTKMDGDARGGAALSMRHCTGKPVKFVTVGEQIPDLQVFYPERMSSRILGMGDILSLVDRASEEMKEEEAEELEKKMRDCTFGFDDFLSQLQKMRRMGGMMSLLKFLPGANKIPTEMLNDDVFKKTEGVICSMTAAERRVPDLITATRRQRIAKGSGTSLLEVNRTIKQFLEMRKMMSQLSKGNKMEQLGNMMNGGALPDMSNMSQMMGDYNAPQGNSRSNINKAKDKEKRNARKKMAKASKKKNRKKR